MENSANNWSNHEDKRPHPSTPQPSVFTLIKVLWWMAVTTASQKAKPGLSHTQREAIWRPETHPFAFPSAESGDKMMEWCEGKFLLLNVYILRKKKNLYCKMLFKKPLMVSFRYGCESGFHRGGLYKEQFWFYFL